MRILIVSSGASEFAVPLSQVREVHERLEVVLLPRGSQRVIGAAPVAGVVLPVVALGEAGLGSGPALVVEGRNGPFAWNVDRIVGLTDVDDHAITPLPPNDEHPFRGVHEHEGRSVLHVEPTSLEPRGFQGSEPSFDLSSLGSTESARAASTLAHADDSVIVVRAGGEVVALPLADVFEIQRAESFVRLPVRDPAVVGLSMVRGNPTLALDLARLVGSPTPVAGETVVVLRRPAAPVALRVDDVIGLRRYDASADFVPATTKGVAEGFIVNGADAQTPLLIDVGRTVDDALARHLQVAPVQRDASVVRSDDGDERRLVLVRLGREIGAIPAEAVERVVDAPSLTPLRSTRSPWLVGAVDVGGRVFPVCDVRSAFGVDPCPPAPRLVLVRDAIGDVILALAADDVDRLVSVPSSHVEPFGFARGGPAVGVVRLASGRIASLLAPESLLGTNATSPGVPS